MRARRYLPLGLLVGAALAVLWAAGRGHTRALAQERADRLRNALAAQLRLCDEEARYLARLPEDEIRNYLTYFQGVARVRLFDARGRSILRVERFDYFVATPPPGDDPVPAPGFSQDEQRLDVDPALRTVYTVLAPRPEAGTLALTVYAEPFPAQVHEAGAALRLGDPPAGGEVHAAGDGWVVAVPATSGAEPLLALLAVAVVALGAAIVLLSERQLRAQERAALERRLARQERLSAIGLLAAGIAHEINNPLEGIANWLRLGDVAKAQEGFERIRTIVGDLLAFARPDVEATRVDAGACVDRACELARYAEVMKGVEIAGRVPAGLCVEASPRTLEQVFLNILLNVGGVGARRVEVEGAGGGGRVKISFTDDGPGIAPEDLPRLFDPFFSRRGGTGLGLSVSYGMVRAAGGAIFAENVRGRGARFTVELPEA